MPPDNAEPRPTMKSERGSDDTSGSNHDRFQQQAALSYAALGLRVFPVTNGKRPYTARGFLDATSEKTQVAQWWDRWPDALIGFPTEGLIVVDIDPIGEGTANSWPIDEAQRKELALAVTSRTPRGGTHHFYKQPDDGYEYRNSTNRLAPKVDVRANGGYVILPPSAIPTRGVYAWVTGDGTDLTELDPAPKWITEACAAKDSGKVQRKTAHYGDNPTQEFMWGALQACKPEADNYEAWVRFGICLQGTYGDEGFSLWLRWSKLSAAFEDGACEAKWPTFKKSGLTVGTVFYMAANKYGWNPDKTGQKEAGSEHPPIEILSSSTLLKMKSPLALVGNMLGANELGMIWGQPGSGKSLLALDLCLAVTRGADWCGRKVQQGPCVYASLEGIAGQRWRLRAAFRDLSDEERDTVKTHLHWIRDEVHLTDSGSVAAILTAIRGLPEPPRLLVIDTLHRASGGKDENDAAAMGELIDGGDRIQREFSSLAVLFVHHSRKDGLVERGSSAIKGAVDVSWSVEKKDSHIVLRSSKAKDWEPFEPYAWDMETVDFGADESGEPRCSVRLQFQGLDKQSVPGVWKLSRTCLTVAEGIGRYGDGYDITKAQLHKALSPSRASIYQAVTDLIDAEYVEDDGRKRGAGLRLTPLGRDRLDAALAAQSSASSSVCPDDVQ